jgi:hypothetical protein
MANITIPPTGTGTATPVVETVDGPASAQRQVVTLGHRGTSTADVLPTALTGAGGLRVGGSTANPSSTLTRPSDTTAYAVGDLVASSTTAGSVSVPNVAAAAASAGSGSIRRLRLYTNKTSGMDGISFVVELWTAAPTFSNGDNGAYAVATGAANFLGSFTPTLTQVADGAYGVALPDVGSGIDFKLASGTAVYWTMKALTAFTPASAQTFTVVAEVIQD